MLETQDHSPGVDTVTITSSCDLKAPCVPGHQSSPVADDLSLLIKFPA